MKTASIIIAAMSLSIANTASAQNKQESITDSAYTVIANPGESAAHCVRINWHTDQNSGKSYCTYTKCSDINWEQARKIKAKQELCTAFDSLFSKKASGEDFYENACFLRNTVELKNLEPGTTYMYSCGTGNREKIRYFKTAPSSGEWSAAIISDFHAYTPLPKRVESAIEMISMLEKRNGNDFDLILHAGDICAWGGSYSFWQDLYSQSLFSKYMWAGVNGNHDNMDRKSTRLSNDYFYYTNNYPENGCKGEKGVCYYFKYSNVLFIMLNSESMRSEEGLAAAQTWVKKTIKSNPSKFIIVMEHYQWFFATDGRTSQYERWNHLFDEYGVDLAISGNNHIYARTNALYKGAETDGGKGTVYIQTPSSDNERGQELKEWTDNKDLIKFRWTEGARTVGALLLKANDNLLQLTLYDRYGNALDSVELPSGLPNIAANPHFQFPPRKKEAVTGSQFIHKVMKMNVEARDSVVYKEIADGNLPDSFKQPTYLTDSLQDAKGIWHKVTLCVLPDFLAIGTDTDFLRIPMLPRTAQKLAELYGATLPTRKLSDLLHRHSLIKLVPHPMTPDSTMTTIPIFARHDSIIESARQTCEKPLYTLISGHKKDIVTTNRIANEPDRLFIYGWHYQDGKPIQPLSAAHGIGYVDYSHGVRLIRDEVLVDGKLYSLKTLLEDPILYRLFSDEAGPMTTTQYRL